MEAALLCLSQPIGVFVMHSDATLRFYLPAEVAKILKCSEWWLKEQARRRRIPFCWIGGSYRFLPEHLTEIARTFERRASAADSGERPPGKRNGQRRSVGGMPRSQASTSQLTARIPPRARRAMDNEAA
jgi:hypothetical protein